MLETLLGFGFKQTEARVYILLAKEGPHTAREIEARLGMPRWRVYESLRNLQKKGTITAFSSRPTLFNAIPFEKVIDLAANAMVAAAQQKQASTNRAILYWRKMVKEESDSTYANI